MAADRRWPAMARWLARRWGAGRGTRERRRPFSLALQGGGAHGAFTWGVLDRVLEEDWFSPEGVSGTSAGAMNAVALASGWLAGGREGARQALSALWRHVAELARLSPLRRGRLPHLALDFTAQFLSPYQLNPLGINPMRAQLEQLIDFERLRRDRSLEVFLAATNVRTGELRIFERHEISADVVLASACLPQVHQAVEIDGEAYWDGGYLSNPPLLPLIERCRAPETLLVQINPLISPTLPTGAQAIRNRIGEIVFGRPLADELARLAQDVRAARRSLRLLDPTRRRLARHRLHVIDGSQSLSQLEPTTKLVPDWATLTRLHETGRAAACAWLGDGPDVVDTVELPGQVEPPAAAARLPA